MSHCFTQPEEIDHVLMAMAGDEMWVDTPIPDEMQPSGAILDVERGEFAVASNFPYGVAHKKSERDLSGS